MESLITYTDKEVNNPNSDLNSNLNQNRNLNGNPSPNLPSLEEVKQMVKEKFLNLAIKIKREHTQNCIKEFKKS